MKFWAKRVYADAAASTPVSRAVQKESKRLEALYGNPGGLHDEAQAAKKELDNARSRTAGAIGAHADEIFFTSGGTESNNLAIFGTLRALLHEHGELNAVTTPVEHPSVLEPLQALEREGLYITYLPVTKEGVVEPKDLREALNGQTVFVSVQMVNSEIGTVQNIREIAKEIRHIKRSRTEVPLYFHTDASQAPLWLPLNVEKLGVDMLTLDAQKMLGPKSSGALYVRRGTQLEPLMFGGGQEQGLRSGTENVVLAGALARALSDAQAGAVACAARVAEVRDYLWSEVKKLFPDAVLYGALGAKRVANNLCFSLPGLSGQMAVVALNTHGVAAATRSACSTGEEAPSHVLKALEVSDTAAREALRVTFLPTATNNDAQSVVAALAKVAKRYRNVVN